MESRWDGENNSYDPDAVFSAQEGKGLRNIKAQAGGADWIFSVLAILVYLALGVVYYHTKLQWTPTEVVYFAFATITTVGYGDFNGSSDSQTMAFTMAYAFAGVGIIGLAIGEIAGYVDAITAKRKKLMMEKMSEDIRGGVASIHEIKHPFPTRLDAWTKETFLRRMVRVMIPVVLVGAAGSTILTLTEDPESDLMQTEFPLVTAFYVSIITSLSIGYGDYYPTSHLGHGFFILFIPFSVVVMLKAIDELNAAVRFLRTTTNVEIVDIKEILLMDESGDGEVDMCEYVMFMLKSTGQVDLGVLEGLENQFAALDTSGDGNLGMDDFPEGLGLKKTHSTFNGNTVTNIEVVALPEDHPSYAVGPGGGGAVVTDPGAAIIESRDEIEKSFEEAQERHQAAIKELRDADAELELCQQELVKIEELESVVQKAISEQQDIVRRATNPAIATKLVV
jgi:hypothetical protein